MRKFEFSIVTRDGQKVESIVIGGRDEVDAERKLKQMYRYCEVVKCTEKCMQPKNRHAMSVEEIVSLISR